MFENSAIGGMAQSMAQQLTGAVGSQQFSYASVSPQDQAYPNGRIYPGLPGVYFELPDLGVEPDHDTPYWHL